MVIKLGHVQTLPQGNALEHGNQSVCCLFSASSRANLWKPFSGNNKGCCRKRKKLGTVYLSERSLNIDAHSFEFKWVWLRDYYHACYLFAYIPALTLRPCKFALAAGLFEQCSSLRRSVPERFASTNAISLPGSKKGATPPWLQRFLLQTIKKLVVCNL